MKQPIQLLPEDLCNKIAAGEVIQRPASVVKELVENSLDAGADDIVISLEQGGRTGIGVSDNGTGMNGDDLLMAFERHATSKIRAFNDLDTLNSMGFRGEALPSIASVSRVECRSAETDGDGHRILIEGGKVRDHSPVSMAAGSVFSIRNLFHNVPARMKFLKNEQVEYRHCLDIVRRFALIHTGVRFTLSHNGKEIFRTSDEDLESRIRLIFGRDQASSLIRVEHDAGGFRISGFLGKPELARGQGNDQFISVNKRIVMDRRLNGAVYSSYGEILEKGRYPFFILNIDLPPSEIDVNVHPAKTEIKFRREFAVFESVRNTVRSALRGVLQNPHRQEGGSEPKFFQQFQHTDTGRELPKARPEQLTMEGKGFRESTMDIDRRLALFEFSNDQRQESGRDRSEKMLWQAHNRYIFAQVSSGVVVVDQHLAHSRILYDRAMKIFSNSGYKGQGQQLLFPLNLELNHMDFNLLLELIPSLEKLGFGLRIFGETSIVIDAVPVEARSMDEGRLLLNILDDFMKSGDKKASLHHGLALAYSDRASIRISEPLNNQEMQNLIDNLFSSSNPYFCPRGKNIVISFSLNELGSRFT